MVNPILKVRVLWEAFVSNGKAQRLMSGLREGRVNVLIEDGNLPYPEKRSKQPHLGALCGRQSDFRWRSRAVKHGVFLWSDLSASWPFHSHFSGHKEGYQSDHSLAKSRKSRDPLRHMISQHPQTCDETDRLPFLAVIMEWMRDSGARKRIWGDASSGIKEWWFLSRVVQKLQHKLRIHREQREWSIHRISPAVNHAAVEAVCLSMGLDWTDKGTGWVVTGVTGSAS